MSAIFYIMGKSAAGKDTVFSRIKKDYPNLIPIVPYTTRPMREGELDGTDYNFVSDEEMNALECAGKVIEKRTYDVAGGSWSYATVDRADLSDDDRYYVSVGSLEAYRAMQAYYGKEKLVPVYLYADDSLRLERSINRERQQENPNYSEVCRRFMADNQDYSIENLLDAGIDPRINGIEMEEIEKDYPKVKRLIDAVLKGE